MFQYQKKTSRNGGFTLIELLITIFLVSVGLIGVIAFLNASLSSQFEAKNEVIAAGLAQEATELVRNIVENNFLNNNPNWYQQIATSKNGTSNCKWLDVDSLSDHKCWTGNSFDVCINGPDGRYLQCPHAVGGKETDFLREIEVRGEEVNEDPGIDIEDGDCLNILVTVGWPRSDTACAANVADCPKKTTAKDVICEPLK